MVFYLGWAQGFSRKNSCVHYFRLLSVSQLCDKDNPVIFTLNRCLVVNMDTGGVVLRGKRHKNVYNAVSYTHLTLPTKRIV